MSRSRAAYEAAVRALAEMADQLLAAGESEERVARALVTRRNRLKAEFRRGLDPAVLAAIEARNLARYGHPVGPSADDLASATLAGAPSSPRRPDPRT